MTVYPDNTVSMIKKALTDSLRVCLEQLTLFYDSVEMKDDERIDTYCSSSQGEVEIVIMQPPPEQSIEITLFFASKQCKGLYSNRTLIRDLKSNVMQILRKPEAMADALTAYLDTKVLDEKLSLQQHGITAGTTITFYFPKMRLILKSTKSEVVIEINYSQKYQDVKQFICDQYNEKAENCKLEVDGVLIDDERGEFVYNYPFLKESVIRLQIRKGSSRSPDTPSNYSRSLNTNTADIPAEYRLEVDQLQKQVSEYHASNVELQLQIEEEQQLRQSLQLQLEEEQLSRIQAANQLVECKRAMEELKKKQGIGSQQRGLMSNDISNMDVLELINCARDAYLTEIARLRNHISDLEKNRESSGSMSRSVGPMQQLAGHISTASAPLLQPQLGGPISGPISGPMGGPISGSSPGGVGAGAGAGAIAGVSVRSRDSNAPRPKPGIRGSLTSGGGSVGDRGSLQNIHRMEDDLPAEAGSFDSPGATPLKSSSGSVGMNTAGSGSIQPSGGSIATAASVSPQGLPPPQSVLPIAGSNIMQASPRVKTNSMPPASSINAPKSVSPLPPQSPAMRNRPPQHASSYSAPAPAPPKQ